MQHFWIIIISFKSLKVGNQIQNSKDDQAIYKDEKMNWKDLIGFKMIVVNLNIYLKIQNWLKLKFKKSIIIYVNNQNYEIS